MRYAFYAALALGLILLGGAAFAQSGQGGYLGKNPAANAPTGEPTPPPPPEQGSGQGGYLGKDPAPEASVPIPPPPERGSGQGGYLGKDPASDPLSDSGSSGASTPQGGNR